MNRRRFLVSAASSGVALAGAGALAAPAAAATDDELAFANFGAATELLLKDFYAKAREAKLFGGQLNNAFVRGGFAATEHVTALVCRVDGLGPDGAARRGLRVRLARRHIRRQEAAATAGLTIVEALLGAYLTGAATSPTDSFRVLYASLAASLGEQRSTLSLARGRPAIGNSFPVALDLEAAGAAVDSFLG